MTDERLKLLLGFAIVVMYITLAALVALGKVEEHTSFGLQYILGALSPVPAYFAKWAFDRQTGPERDQKGTDAKDPMNN